MSSVFIKTFGCSLNHADSEAMEGVLAAKDQSVVSKEQDAEVIVVNSCIVKGHSQAQLFTYVKRMESLGKKVVVAGCGAQGIPDRLTGYSLVGTHQVGRIADAVEATLAGETLVAIEKDSVPRLSLPKVRRSPIIDIIPINAGCLGACTFCITKKSRGSLVSYQPRDIVESVESAVKDGVKEIWLTSPDTAVYGVDLRFPIPKLLARVCEIEGDFQVRLGMGNPNWFIKYLDDLPSAFSHPKMFRFMHVPVQAGNDQVLEDMKRGYQASEFVQIVDRMRQTMPDMTISTDIIVGFPGETDEQFQDTVRILERTKPDVLNLSRFTARPGTPAERMPNQVPGAVRKERSTIIDALHEKIALERNQRWIGWKGRILIDEVGKHDSMIGRNYAYKPVVVPGSYPLGSLMDVEVVEVHPYFLKAKIISSDKSAFSVLK